MAGRPKTLQSPDEMLQLYERYKESVKNERWEKEEAIKSGQNAGEVVKIKLSVPLTIEGFKVFCFYEGISNIHQYLYNKDEAYSEFSPISTHIRDEIRHHQVTGGMIGLYNANLTARLNNISEKTIHEGGDVDKPIIITGMQIVDSNKEEE